MRSEHHCQTVEPRDKSEQTNRDVGIMTNMCNFFYWGLRGQKGYGQHSLDLVQPHLTQKLKRESFLQLHYAKLKSGSSFQYINL